MKVALYLFPNLLGHVNPTTLLSKKLVENNWKVVYCGVLSMLGFTVKNGFALAPLTTYPFLYPPNQNSTTNSLQRWLLNFISKWDRQKLQNRRNELQTLIEKYKPSLIFIDPFYYSDFILIQHIDPKIRCVFLNVRFPSSTENWLIPPSNRYAFPNNGSKTLWRKQRLNRFFKETWKTIAYAGKSDRNILLKEFKKQGIDKRYAPNLKNLYLPSFSNSEEWFLFPKELDFLNQKLTEKQKYIPMGIDQERYEKVDNNIIKFLEKKEDCKNAKLIYCSMGSISKLQSSLRSAPKDLDNFYQTLVQIAIENPKLYFIIAAQEQPFKAIPENCYIASFIPQQYILKRANLMINHGGGSINEAAYYGVPMLVLPINEKWDFNGNAARIVYHRLGKKGDLTDTMEKITLTIIELLSDIDLLYRCKEKSKELQLAIKSFDLNPHINA